MKELMFSLLIGMITCFLDGVVATTYHKGQMISLTSKSPKKYDVGIHKRT